MNKATTSRRTFIKQNSIAAIATIVLGNTPAKSTGSFCPEKTGQNIGGLSLTQLQKEYHAALFERFLPNMQKIVIDHQYGGFMCDVDLATSSLLSSGKSAWFEGRGIWTYSYLYNNFGKNPQHLEVARKSKDFILKHQPVGKDFWISSYSKEGVPDHITGDIYCNLFIAEGLAEFARASGEAEYFDKAKSIALAALQRYDSRQYTYPINYGPAAVNEIPAPRVLGHWMVFLRFATQFLEQRADPEMEQLAARCVDAIMNHHLNGKYELLNEALDHELNLPADEWQEFAYLGHGIETLWMVMAEALRKSNKKLFNRAAEAFKRHVTVSCDVLEGGYFRALDHVDNYIFKTDKVLWLQEEVLNGCLVMYEHTQDAWAAARFAETYNYIQQKFVHAELPFIVETGSRNMESYQKKRAEHYHHPRRLMLNLLAFERMSINGKT